MTDRGWPVAIVGMERVSSRGLKSVKVLFEIDRGEFLEPVLYSVNVPASVDDAEIVKLARNYVARQLADLAEQTASWTLTEDQVREIAPRE